MHADAKCSQWAAIIGRLFVEETAGAYRALILKLKGWFIARQRFEDIQNKFNKLPWEHKNIRIELPSGSGSAASGPSGSGPAASGLTASEEEAEDTYHKLREVLSGGADRQTQVVLMAAHLVQLGFAPDAVQAEEENWMQIFEKDPRRARWDYGLADWFASGGPTLRDRLLKLLAWLAGRVQWMDKNPDTELSDYDA